MEISCELRDKRGRLTGEALSRTSRKSARLPGLTISSTAAYRPGPAQMPTATATTTTTPSVATLKTFPTAQPASSAAATLRSLYPRAARAFLQRDVALTHSLLTSAFSLISPPASLAAANDALSSHRRKWDILRITFETTLYASPPSTHDPETLPSALRADRKSVV